MFGLVGLCYAASGTYFISTISTIEKRFKIPSRTSGNYSWSLHMTSSSNKIFIKELSGFRCCGLHRLNHLHQNHLNNYSVTHVAFNIHSAFITNFTPQTNKQTTRSRFQPHLQLYHIFPKKKLDACSSEKHGYRICP